jgi:uncharacterized membrane protein
VTATAIAGIRKEAAAAGMTLEAAMRMCCERGWAGFKADWAAGKAGEQMSKQQRLEAAGRQTLETIRRKLYDEEKTIDG